MSPSIGECVCRACTWEATARKAGNVHRFRDLGELRYADFLASAAAVAPIFDRAGTQPVGRTILEAIQATRAVVSTNTNLGIVLLLAPLAAVPAVQSLRRGVPAVLAALDVNDSRQVFTAIRLAQPGGLAQVAAEDVSGEPTLPLRQVMALAAERDLVARQYANDFHDVFEVGGPLLLDGLNRFGNLEDAIIFAQLGFLARFPDSLITRKRGAAESEQARRLAQEVLDAGWPESASGRQAFAAFDAWLTAEGNTRNPGTSADLVTACLFAALREHDVERRQVPFARPERDNQ